VEWSPFWRSKNARLIRILLHPNSAKASVAGAFEALYAKKLFWRVGASPDKTFIYKKMHLTPYLRHENR
jgi:hypothetical protein